MTFQRQTDKKPFQSQIIPLGMNPIKDDATSRIKANIKDIRTLYPAPWQAILGSSAYRTSGYDGL